MVDLVRSMSTNLIARIKDTKSKEIGFDQEDAGQVFFHPQPLFEAIAISIRAPNFDCRAPKVAHLPVLIVCTGIETHLSAPIMLEKIPADVIINECADESGVLIAVETRLEVAITYLMELEQREAAACPPLPNLQVVMQNMTSYRAVNGVAWAASDLGWDVAAMGPLNGPSSSWSDPDMDIIWLEKRQKLDKLYLREADNACRLAKSEFERKKAELLEASVRDESMAGDAGRE